MDAISYITARANLAGVMNRVCEDHEPLIITRNGDALARRLQGARRNGVLVASACQCTAFAGCVGAAQRGAGR